MCRALQRAGAQVRVLLSAETEMFVPALTFQTLTGGEVVPADAMYGTMVGGHFRPLSAWVESVAAMVMIPATPALLAKAAGGCADEALVRALLLYRGPPCWPSLARQPCISMSGEAQSATFARCWHHLRCRHSDPTGASDELGWSLSAQQVVDTVAGCLQQATALTGKVVIVTAGPTQEPIDPVRHISNRASGKTGFALAEAARRRGARVILVTGPRIWKRLGVQCIRIQTALEMRQAVLDHYEEADVVIKTAAVADFRPKFVAQAKVKKDVAELGIPLERNRDILAELGQHKGHRVLVGFAAETQDLLANAAQKVRHKQLDFIVANDISDPSMGFASDANRVHILDAAGQIEELPTMAKAHIADYISTVCRLS